MGNGSLYIHTHYALAFIVNSIHVFSHLRLKSAPEDFKTSSTAVTCAHNQWWHSKKERNIFAHAVTCAQNQWQKHYNNLRHLLQQSITENKWWNTERKILKSHSASPATYVRNQWQNIMTSYKNLRNLLPQLISCKICCKIQLKNLNYLPPQSLACEVYRKQEN